MLAHVLWRSHDAPVLQRLRDAGRQGNSFPVDLSLLRCFDAVHAQARASFWRDGGGGVRRRVHSLSRQRDDRSFRTLARSHLLARVRFVMAGFEHLTSMSQTLPLQNLNRGTIKRTAS